MKKFLALLMVLVLSLGMIAFAETAEPDSAVSLELGDFLVNLLDGLIEEFATENAPAEAVEEAVEEAPAEEEVVEAPAEEEVVEETPVEEEVVEEAPVEEEIVEEAPVEEEIVEEAPVEEEIVEEEPACEHEWDYEETHACTLCGEMYPCWNAEECLYIHTFEDGACTVCGTAQFCEVEGHEPHALAACGIPGHFEGDGKDHTFFMFDADKHTKCLSKVHYHHCDSCGDDYDCKRGGSHTACLGCGRPWCDKSHGDHTFDKKGNRRCEYGGMKKK